jgi:anti-sigma regulatory factor (Ser/Thr protein kinase)
MPVYKVRDSLDVFAPRQAAFEIAGKLGFPRHESRELSIAVSELASNIVKYGVRGTIEVQEVRDAELGVGVSVVARDVGPPFHNLAMALQDGCDQDGPIDPVLLLKRAGLGIGLGAVVRFTDTFDVAHGESGK